MNAEHPADLKQFEASLKELATDHPSSGVRSILTSDGLIDTSIDCLEHPPTVPHPRAGAYAKKQIVPFTPYDASIAVAIDTIILARFAEARMMSRMPVFRMAGQRSLYKLAFAPLRVGLVAAGGVAPALNMVIDSIIKRHGYLAQAAGVSESTETGFPKGLEILGYRGGYEGLLRGDSIRLTHKVTDPIALAPGCRLGIRRGRKDSGDGALFAQLAEALARDGLDIFYVIGGDGTLTAANQIAIQAAKRGLVGSQGYRVRIVGAPKTMDNDINYNDVTFGYETVVEEAKDLVQRIHADVEACGRIGVVELFGAASGFVAMDAANLSGEADDVMLPEECLTAEAQSSEIDRVARRLALRWRKKGHALLVVAEGASGTFAHGQSDKKQNDFAQLFERLRDKIIEFAPEIPRGDIISNRPQHLIRSVPPLATDLRLCKMLGKLMVDTALAGFSGCTVSRLHARFCLVPFALAAGSKRKVALDEDLVSIFLDKRSLD